MRYLFRVLLLALLILASCGKKAPPTPIERKAPEPAEESNGGASPERILPNEGS